MLFLDIETYSATNLPKCGVHRYVSDPTFRILLISYAVDDGEVVTCDLTKGEKLPMEVRDQILDDAVEKHAWNAAFERVCLSKYFGTYLKPESWRCTMVHAASLALPLSLKDCGAVLKIKDEKLDTGRALIRKFCVPDKETGLVVTPDEAPDDWQDFIRYNQQDVLAEREIYQRLRKIPVPEHVWKEYALDQRINDRGILLDLDLARASVEVAEKVRSEQLSELEDITGLENPNSPLQMKAWLEDSGLALESLSKADVLEALENSEGEIKRALELRLELSKSSIRKYNTMCDVACADHRARGLVQFLGANRTGRWSGRLIQVQNLKRNDLEGLATARELVKQKNIEAISMLYGSVPDTLSQLVRTAFIPKPGHRFIVADFSAIEARVIAWLAGENWVLDAFRNGQDIYCETASQMFGVKVEKHGENSELRQKGKACCLACGYGGSVGALKAMGADKLGMTEDEMAELVERWRMSNRNITAFWRELEFGAKEAIKAGIPQTVYGLKIYKQKGFLFIELPSGRKLAYCKPEFGVNRFGNESITYWGNTVAKPWTKLETYGGKLTENVTQAVARDLLAHSMLELEKSGYKIVMHVHDEVVLEVPEGVGSLDEACAIMGRAPSWAEGLPLVADGYECEFYRKE